MASHCWKFLLFTSLLSQVHGNWADYTQAIKGANNENVENEMKLSSNGSVSTIDNSPTMHLFKERNENGKRFLEITRDQLSKSMRSYARLESIQCDNGFYRVEGVSSAPCEKYQHSDVEASTWCCNCNQGEQWKDWQWTYVKDARQEACVSNIYISSKGWIVVRILASIVVGLMTLGIILPLLVTCGDSGPRVGCCVKGPFLFGCRDKTGCWWRTDSRSLIMMAFMPFYVCEALAMTKFVESLDLNIHPKYDLYSQSLGLANLVLTTLCVCCMPLAWFCFGVNGQMRGRRHIMRREKNGFTISLFHSWHLHAYFYYCSLAAEVAMLVITATWLMTVALGDPEIRNSDGTPITNVVISPSRDDLFALVESVFWIHVLSFLHIIIGIRVYNDQYFKAKFSGVKLVRRGACFFVDYCVEEPLIKSLDCDYKKFVWDNDGNFQCVKETFSNDEATERSDTKIHEGKAKLITSSRFSKP